MQRGSSGLCDGHQTMTDSGFWRLMTILSFVDDVEAQTQPFCWFITCWMSNLFSSVNTRFGSLSVGHLLEDFPAFLGPHGHMIVPKLLATQHFEGLHPQIVPSTLGALWICSYRRGGQGSAATVRILSQVFPWFSRSSGEWTFRFLPRPDRSRVFPISWNFFTPLNGLYPDIWQIQHYFFHFCEAKLLHFALHSL